MNIYTIKYNQLENLYNEGFIAIATTQAEALLKLYKHLDQHIKGMTILDVEIKDAYTGCKQ